MFAAAAHTGKTDFASGVNLLRIRIDRYYYNSRVLLMDLEQMRKTVCPKQLFSYAKKH